VVLRDDVIPRASMRNAVHLVEKLAQGGGVGGDEVTLQRWGGGEAGPPSYPFGVPPPQKILIHS